MTESNKWAGVVDYNKAIITHQRTIIMLLKYPPGDRTPIELAHDIAVIERKIAECVDKLKELK